MRKLLLDIYSVLHPLLCIIPSMCTMDTIDVFGLSMLASYLFYNEILIKIT